ncbi:unnamed protein product [Caretta caretta]
MDSVNDLTPVLSSEENRGAPNRACGSVGAGSAQDLEGEPVVGAINFPYEAALEAFSIVVPFSVNPGQGAPLPLSVPVHPIAVHLPSLHTALEGHFLALPDCQSLGTLFQHHITPNCWRENKAY